MNNLNRNKNGIKQIVVTFLLLTTLCSCVFFRPGPEKLYKRATKNKPYDVIIVPGVPFDGKNWNRVMKGRVIWAVHLVKKGIANNIIFSGGAVYSAYSEAKIMGLYAQQLGISKNKIIYEEKAEHSTENIYYAYHMAKKMGYTKIALATDPPQSRLLMGFTKRRFKLPIAHIPFIIDTLKTIHDVSPVIDPKPAYRENFKSILETQSKRYRRKGTLGKNIKFEKE